MKLEDILNTTSITLEHDSLTLRIVPFTNAQALAWNRATFQEAGDRKPLEHSEVVQAAQLDLLAKHLRACVTDGKATKVTAKWVGEQIPQNILQDLATYCTTGQPPGWSQDRK